MASSSPSSSGKVMGPPQLAEEYETQINEMLHSGDTNLGTIGLAYRPTLTSERMKLAVRFKGKSAHADTALNIKVANYEVIRMRKLFDFMTERCRFIEEATIYLEMDIPRLELEVYPHGLQSHRSRRGDENKFCAMKAIPRAEFEEDLDVIINDNGTIARIGTKYIPVTDPSFSQDKRDVKRTTVPLTISDFAVMANIKRFMKFVHSAFRKDFPLTFDDAVGYEMGDFNGKRKAKKYVLRAWGFTNLNVSQARTLCSMHPIAIEDIILYPEQRCMEVIWRSSNFLFEEMWVHMAAVAPPKTHPSGDMKFLPRDYFAITWKKNDLSSLGRLDNNPIHTPSKPPTTFASSSSSSLSSSLKRGAHVVGSMGHLTQGFKKSRSIVIKKKESSSSSMGQNGVQRRGSFFKN